jgi:ryanodine receptor 2
MSDYIPCPIDIGDVDLPPELTGLTERLAANAHDNWALQRLRDGWRYGSKRDDAARTHPCLLPYEQLPESEKEYDRRTAIETLKAVLALGYRIQFPDESSPV